MTYETIALWEIIIDAMGLVLCLAVLAYVVRCRNRALAVPAADKRNEAFSAEIRLQMLEQKAEAALAALSLAADGANAAPEAVMHPSVRPTGRMKTRWRTPHRFPAPRPGARSANRCRKLIPTMRSSAWLTAAWTSTPFMPDSKFPRAKSVLPSNCTNPAGPPPGKCG